MSVAGRAGGPLSCLDETRVGQVLTVDVGTEPDEVDVVLVRQGVELDDPAKRLGRLLRELLVTGPDADGLA